MKMARACLEKISPYQFWFIVDRYSDFVRYGHVQIKHTGNLGTDGSVSCITNTDGELCLFLWKERVENVSHFFWTALILDTIMDLFGQT